MDALAPKVITRSDPAYISIEWGDGHLTTFTTAELRRICPCAGCVDEVTGHKLLDPQSVSTDLVHRDVRLVGRYALSLDFSDGHRTGIYTFRFLRDHDPSAPAPSGPTADQ
jgi:DUF971 family protein